MGKVLWKANAQAVAQETTVTFANIEAGDAFTLTINDKDIAVSADASLTAAQDLLNDVVSKFVEAIGDFDNDIAEWAEVSASAASDGDGVIIGLLLTGDDTGKPFTVTGTSSDGDNTSVSITETVPGVAPANEKQTITIDSLVTGGTFTLTFDGQTTTNIAYNASASTVQTALEGLSNIASGDVTVTGSAGGPWTVEFKGTYAATDVPLLEADGSSLTITGAYSIEVMTTTQGAAGLNEVQVINIGNPASGTYTLTFSGETTGALAYNASAGAIQTALEALSNIAPGDVTVTAIAPASGVRFQVEFKGAYRNTNVPLLTGDGSSLDGWAGVLVEVVTQGSAVLNAKVHFTAVLTGIRIVGEDESGAGNDLDMTINGSTFNNVETESAGKIRYLGTGLSSTEFHVELVGVWAGLKVYDNSTDAAENSGIYLRFINASNGATMPFTLDQQATGTGVNEMQRVSLTHGPTGGTFTLTFQGQTTGTIAYNASAATVKAALEALSTIGSGNVAVTGNAGGPWTITFQGTLASTDVATLSYNASGLTGNEILATVFQQATAYTNEVQQAQIVGSPSGGTFTLSWDGTTTAAIAFDASAADVQAALVTAFGGSFSVTGEAGGPWLVEFTGTWLGANQSQMGGDGSSLTGSIPNISTTQDAVEAVNEQQRIELLGSPAGGTFTLTYSGQTTSAIPYNASAATVQNALVALSNIGSVDVSVSGGAGGPWTVTFRDNLGSQNVTLLTGDGSSLTPGAGTQTVAITTTTSPTGPNWVDNTDNYVGGALPANSDELIIDGEIPLLYGLEALSAVTLSVLRIKSTFAGAGKIGLPVHNGSYYEYRPTAMKIGATQVIIGEGDGAGSDLIKINSQAVQTELVVMQSAEPDDDVAAIYWRGSHASNVVRITKGSLGIGIERGDDTATVDVLEMGYRDSPESDVKVTAGNGVTIGTLTKLGGEGYLGTAPDEIVNYVGKLRVLDGAITSAIVHAGEFIYDGDDTIALARATSGDAEIRLDQATDTCIITDLYLHRGATFRDPQRRATLANPLHLVQCGIEDVTLDFGPNLNLTVAAGA